MDVPTPASAISAQSRLVESVNAKAAPVRGEAMGQGRARSEENEFLTEARDVAMRDRPAAQDARQEAERNAAGAREDRAAAAKTLAEANEIMAKAVSARDAVAAAQAALGKL